MLENILNTITNNSITVYDELKPYSFIQFLKFYNSSVSTKEIIAEYNIYIQEWCRVKNDQYDVNIYKNIIKQEYIALLKEITLDYTTTEERRFLSNLTITDEILNNNDKLNNLLDIILPFYIEKINNICKYYINKRHEYKFNIQNNKNINSPSVLKTTIKNIIIDELTTNISDYNSIPLSNINEISQILDIDIVNLYDNHNYFEKFEDFIPNNSNEINYKIFEDYDEALIEAIRQYPFYLVESNIYAFSVNPDVKSSDLNYLPVKDFINNIKSSDKNDVILNLQKQLIEKFSGSDYYYISTSDTITNPTSGLLIEADNTIFNILNVDILNTPTIDNGVYDDVRRIGINFTPDKFGLLFYNTNNLKYEIDYSKLQPNSIYVFPDPNKFNRNDVPLIWFIDTNKVKLNYTTQYAFGRPKSDPLIQYFYSYFSTDQKQDSTNTKLITFKNKFESILNDKIITQYKYDIFGNEYALFKEDLYYKYPKIDNNLDYSNGLDSENDCIFVNRILDGRNTTDFCPYYTSLPFNIALGQIYYYKLIMGDYGINNFTIYANIYDHYNLLVDGNSIIPSIGLSSYLTNITNWPNLSNISYNFLLDSGIASYLSSNNQGETVVKIPQNSLELTAANITYGDYNCIYDGGMLYTNGYVDKIESPIITSTNNTIISTIPLSDIKEETDSVIEKTNQSGILYFKNAYTGDILLGSQALSAIYNKFNLPKYVNIYNELINNEIIDIDIINDVIFITTKNYIIYDKLVFENNEITKSIYGVNYIELNHNSIDKPSTYFYLDNRNKVAYVQIVNLQNNIHYPILKLINLDDLQVETLSFNNDTNFIISEFNWDDINVAIDRISTPKLIYNSLNNLYNLSIMCYDQNNMPYLYNISFIYNINDIILYSNRFYTNNNSITNIINQNDILINTNSTFNNEIILK